MDLYAAHLDDVNHGKAVPHRKKEPSTQGVREGGQRTPNSVWLLAGRASRNGRARSLLHGGIERGEHNIALINIQKIADALDLSVSDLLKTAGI